MVTAIPVTVMDLRKLKAHRLVRGLSASELARRIGVTPDTMGFWEAGKVLMHMDSFRKICLEYDLDYFEIAELLRLKPIDLHYVISFRAACKREGKKPIQVILDFFKVYAELV